MGVGNLKDLVVPAYLPDEVSIIAEVVKPLDSRQEFELWIEQFYTIFKVLTTGHLLTCLSLSTGAGFWGASTFLYNMSALKADQLGGIGTIYCHSSATSANVGRWISPQGLDITTNFTDPFSIQFSSGPGYFSYNTFELLTPLSWPFTTTYDGVYTCLVPDDLGIMQTLHIGIFSNQYTST